MAMDNVLKELRELAERLEQENTELKRQLLDLTASDEGESLTSLASRHARIDTEG